MELKAVDFEKLQYNVHPIDISEDILKSFPDLSRFPEFTEQITQEEQEIDIDKNKVLRYIFYCYDKRTPFMSEKNMIRRKILCAQEAGFKTDKDGKFTKEVDDILKGFNDSVNRMIIRFVRNQRDLRYSLMVAGLENYYDNITKLTEIREKDKAKDGNIKTELFNNLKKMLDDLELLADEVFNNDKDLIFVADQINEEETGKIQSYPEFIARQRVKDE